MEDKFTQASFWDTGPGGCLVWGILGGDVWQKKRNSVIFLDYEFHNPSLPNTL